MDLGLPHGMLVAAVRRGGEVIVPRGNVALKSGDYVVLGAESLKDDKHIDLKEMVLSRNNPWTGQHIRDLDISRHTFIVMVRRGGTMLIPKGDMVLLDGDHIILYSQSRIPDADTIEL